MADGVMREKVGAVCVLTLDAPASRNALSTDVRTLLRGHVRDAMADDAVRVIILTGAGGNFCSGGQLQPVDAAAAAPDAERTRANMAIMQDVARLFVTGPKPCIAAVEGFAFGAGLSLASACDLVVAGEGAKFCASFGRVGLMADAGLLSTLAKRVGAGRARDILFTARTLTAAEAAEMGLVERLAPTGEALATALAIAHQIAALAPLAIAAMKRVLSDEAVTLEAVLAAEADIQPRLTYSTDYLEGRAAFREKRAPRFTGA